jgi:hypothetical protein
MEPCHGLTIRRRRRRDGWGYDEILKKNVEKKTKTKKGRRKERLMNWVKEGKKEWKFMVWDNIIWIINIWVG